LFLERLQMKLTLILLAVPFIVSAAALAQVAPAATGPSSPGELPVSGTLRYDLRYSQIVQFYGGPQGDAQSSAASGDVTYANSSHINPFSLTYSGGDMWPITGSYGETGVFQHLLVSQGVLRRHWSLNLSDNVSYMPQAPTMGFSGIPGVGSLPSEPSPPIQPILTLNTRSIYNTVNSNFSYSLDHATSLGVNGSYTILRFPDGNGLETDQWQTGSQLTRRLNAHNSLSGQYSFSHFSYPGYDYTMETQSAMFAFTRSWNRRLTTTASAGPQWIMASASAGIPSSNDLSVSANGTYSARSTTARLSYTQGATGGAGVSAEVGARNHDVSAGLAQQLGRNMSVNVTGAYMRTQGLQQVGAANGYYNGVTNSVYGGVSATRQLGRDWNVFANYMATHQSSSAALPANVISGLSQVIGFGLSYSPRELHFRK
jgi:hypothetical protein